jgi:MoaA/NifB/PqqE/SkfB family radical SAM enzyme
MKKYKKIYLEITNSCNLNCAFCPKTERAPQFMDEKDFRLILDRIKGRFEYLNFHVMGEPLLHPKLGLFLDICEAYGYKVNITTNGTLIDRTEFLLDKPALRMLSFSLHSCEGTAYENYLKKVFDFTDKALAAGKMQICFRLWNLKENENNTGNNMIIEKIVEKYAPNLKIDDKATHVRSIKVAERLFLNKALEFEWPDLDREEIGSKGFCYGLREQIGILVDATVVPCCLDKDGVLKLGNLKDDQLDNIIKGKRARAIYDGFSSKKTVEELCKKCGYRTRFDK